MSSTSPQRDTMMRMFARDPLLMAQTLLPASFNKKSADFHQQIVTDYMSEEFNKFCWIAPRGHAKSTIVGCLLVLHHITFSAHNQKFIILASKTEGHSIALLDTLKNILSGEAEYGAFAEFFGPVTRKTARKWGTRSIELPDRTVIVAKGTGQQIVGAKKDAQRPTLIIVDDPEDLSNTKTKEAMEMNQKWLFRQVVPSLDPKGRICVIGTPQNELCIVETLHRMKGEWLCRRWSAISGEGWETDITRGRPLWPSWKSIESLYAFFKDCQSIGRTSYFYMEYQCVVQGDADRKFNANMFRYWRGELVNNGAHTSIHGHFYSADGTKGGDLLLPVSVQVGVDLASTITETADWSVMFPWALTWHKEMFQLPYQRFRKHPMQTAELLATQLRALDPDYVFIETQNFQIMMRDMLREFYELNYSGMSKKIHYSENKEDRIFNKLQPFYSQGKAYHYHGQCEDLEKELLMFPRSRFDDTMDAASTALYRTIWPQPAVSKDTKAESDDAMYDDHTPNDSWMTT